MGYYFHSEDRKYDERKTVDEAIADFHDCTNGPFEDETINLRCFDIRTDEDAGGNLIPDVEPTAEWSRITQALKERDELAAELERVKAENYQLKGNQRQYERQLESLKSRLPVNADGDVPDIGDKQWYWYDYPGSSPEELDIECIRDNGGGWEFGFTNGAWHFSSYCHSTAESCRAAHEGKEGENDAN